MPDMPPFAVLKLRTGAEFSSDLDKENRQPLRSFLGGSTGDLIYTVTIGRNEEVAHRIAHALAREEGINEAGGVYNVSKLSVREIPSQIPGVKIRGYWSREETIMDAWLKKRRKRFKPLKSRYLSVGTGHELADNPDDRMLCFLSSYLSSDEGGVSAFDDDPGLEAFEIVNEEQSDESNRLASVLIDGSRKHIRSESSGESVGLEDWLSQPAPTPSEVAAIRLQARSDLRDEILRKVTLLSPKEVARACGNSTENARTFGRRLRHGGALAVREANAYKFPAFQFMESGRVNPLMKDVLKSINSGRSDEEISDGWPALFWFYVPSGLLAGERPMDVFVRDPARVLEAANRRFASDR